MFETLMKNGSYRIDYLNHSSRRKAESIALYICGAIEENELYSRSAKRRLYMGLGLIAQKYECQNLVAVYLDVCSGDSSSRPALARLNEDARKGYFHRVFIYASTNSLECRKIHDELRKSGIQDDKVRLIIVPESNEDSTVEWKNRNVSFETMDYMGERG